MRKTLTSVLVVAVCLMFASAMAYAGPNCGATKTADKTAAKSSCSGDVTAKMTSAEKSADKDCAVTGKTVSAKADCDPAECDDWAKKAAKYENAEVRMMSVKGMTCGGCENSIKSSLAETAGVYEVAKVCHKGGVAVVIVDPKEIKDDVLTTTVTNKGYEAAIIPAVATTSDNAEASKASSTAKKDCAATCAKPCDAAKKAETSGSTPH